MKGSNMNEEEVSTPDYFERMFEKLSEIKVSKDIEMPASTRILQS